MTLFILFYLQNCVGICNGNLAADLQVFFAEPMEKQTKEEKNTNLKFFLRVT